MNEARIKEGFSLKAVALFFSFNILHIQIFIQQNILGAMKILWKWSKMLEVVGGG